MSPKLHHKRLPGSGHPSRWMRGALVAAVACGLLSIVGPPAAYAVDGPARHSVAVVKADATSVGRPVAPQPQAAPPVPASAVPASAAPASAAPASAAPADEVPADAAPVSVVDFVWLLPLVAGLAVLGIGVVLSRRSSNDDSD